MTIIGAVMCCDHILVASDSEAVDERLGIKRQIRKLWKLPASTVLWGVAGAETTASIFYGGFHLRHDAGSWKVITEAAESSLYQANRKALERWPYPRTRLDPGPLCDVLIAGFVSGEPRIYEVPDTGVPIDRTRDGVLFIGAGVGKLYEWHSHGSDPSSCRRAGFVDAMHRATYEVAGCGPPVQLWEVTSTAATRAPVPPYEPRVVDAF